jgi:glycosyltransferase involved in cell wall biosynthesis
MPRILHVISGLKVGGAEMMLYRLILSERRGEYEHVVVALDPVGEMRERFRQAGIELIIFDFKRAPIKELFRLARLIRRLKPAIVQTWLYHADLLGGVAARLAGCQKVIWGVRTTDVAKGGSRATARVRWLCARLSHWVPHTIVCAAEAARRAHAGLGYCAKRMVVIPNGFDMSRMHADALQVSALRQSCDFDPDTLVIGTLGRFNPAKDQHNFVRAAGMLAPAYAHAKFLLVGRDCDEGNETLAEWIAATGVEDRFVLLGERSDVPVCLSAMDLFALPSRTEGFPNVLAEAMAMGRPCVTADVGDAAIVLGDCGVIVPPEDSTALAQGLTHLLSLTPQQREELGTAAHARIAEVFSMARSAERFAAVYEDVLKNPRVK